MYGRDLPAYMARLRKFRAWAGSSPLPFMQRWVGIVGITVLAESILIELRWLTIATILLGVAAFHAARFVQPPFVLYLAASGTHSRDLANMIVAASLPFQATNLLRIEKNRGMVDAFSKALTTRQATDLLPWAAAVAEMTDIAKVIFVDTRSLSEALEEEFAILSRGDVWFKTIVIEDHIAERAQVFSSVMADLGVVESQALFVTARDVVPLIKRLKLSPADLPTKEHPIALARHEPT